MDWMDESPYPGPTEDSAIIFFRHASAIRYVGRRPTDTDAFIEVPFDYVLLNEIRERGMEIEVKDDFGNVTVYVPNGPPDLQSNMFGPTVAEIPITVKRPTEYPRFM